MAELSVLGGESQLFPHADGHRALLRVAEDQVVLFGRLDLSVPVDGGGQDGGRIVWTFQGVCARRLVGTRMSAGTQPLGSHPGRATRGGTGQNGATRHHELSACRPVSDDVAPDAGRKVNGTGMTPIVADPDALMRRHRIYRQAAKPAIDRVIAASLLLLLSPVIAAVTLGVRVLRGSGVVFRQRRIGLGGTEFTIYKFRTMAPDRRHGDGTFDGPDRRTTHKSDDDPRHTAFGRFLRKYSLDELPQLVNVLNGDMSLVGPRPELVDVAVATGIVDHPRHLVKPGLTGLWQVSPARGQLIVDGLDLDIEYVASCGPLTDFRILALTAPAVWRRTGS